ncbi:MAG: flagellar basal body rod protein FlgB [Spirochaetia bacterium]|nr:flagellar basal body rod protein FlgB [Spirochaetia bacterium]
MQSLKMLEMGLDAAMVRRNVLANNIANVDVPHFKRSEVSFEENIRRAIDSTRREREEPLLNTIHKEHIAGRKGRDFRRVVPQIHTDYNSSMRNDGNNVDMEDEIAKLNRNQLHYNLMADRAGKKLRHLNSLVRLA